MIFKRGGKVLFLQGGHIFNHPPVIRYIGIKLASFRGSGTTGICNHKKGGPGFFVRYIIFLIPPAEKGISQELGKFQVIFTP